MKRAAAIIIGCAMITGALVSCGKSSSSSEEIVSTEAVSETAATTEEVTTEADTTEADTTQSGTSLVSEAKSADDFKGDWKLKDIINKETGTSYIYDGSEDPDTSPTERIRLQVTDDKIMLITLEVSTSELGYTFADGSLNFTDSSGMEYKAIISDGELVLENSLETAYFTPYTGTDTDYTTMATKAEAEPDLSELNGGDIVGKWTPEDEESKFSFIIDFNADKTMLISVNYSSFLSFKDGKAVVPYAENVETEFDGTKLVVKADGENLFEFERISGETDKNNFDGRYKVISESGTAPTDIKSDIIYAEIRGERFYYCNSSFTYKIDGNNVVLESNLNDGSEAVNYLYGVDGDRLKIYNQEDKVLTDFVRTEE